MAAKSIDAAPEARMESVIGATRVLKTPARGCDRKSTAWLVPPERRNREIGGGQRLSGDGGSLRQAVERVLHVLL